jgi:hypothetical protein
MRMSHIQPVMVEMLLERGGQASIREIAAQILAHDERAARLLRADRQEHAWAGGHRSTRSRQLRLAQRTGTAFKGGDGVVRQHA